MSLKSGNGQVSLIRVKSNAPKCWVFFEGQQLQKYELPVDDCTTVQNVIAEAVALVRAGATSLGLECPEFQLYASRKSGRKVSDLPSLEGKQAILKTGLKFFILKGAAKDGKQARLSSASTRSIQSEIKVAPLKKEVQAAKESGCFCF